MNESPDDASLRAVESRPLLPRPALNVLSNWAGFLVGALVSFFLSPFIIRTLGDSTYGVWVLIGSITGYLGLLDLGVRGATARYVSSAHARADHEDAGRVASTSLAIFMVSGAVAILVSVAIAFLVIDRFKIPEEFVGVARLVLCIAGANVAVSLVSGVFGGMVTALQRFDLANVIEIAGALLRAALIVIVLNSGQGIVALATVQLAMSVLTGAAYVVLARRLYPQARIARELCGRGHLQEILTFSFFSFVLLVSRQLIFFTDSIVIGAFLPVSSVTYFAIASNLIIYARAVLSGISTTVSPMVSALNARGDDAGARVAVLKAARVANFIMLPIVVTFMTRGETFINLWVGPGYGDLSGRVLWVLSLAHLFAAPNHIAAAAMYGLSRHKGVAPVALGEAVVNLGLSIALIGPLGILGVAWGTTLPELVVGFLFWPWYIRRTLHIPVREYVVAVWLRPLVAVAPFAALSYWIDRFLVPQTLALFFLEVTVLVPVALAGFWYGCMSRTERHSAWAMLPRKNQPK